MNSKLNIIAIGHDASRTGAPILLNEFCRWMHRKGTAEVRMLLGRGGPLQEEARSLFGQRNVFSLADRYFEKTPTGRNWPWSSKTTIQADGLAEWVHDGATPSLIFVNTVAGIPILNELRELTPDPIPTVIHVHELSWIIRSFERSHGISQQLQQADALICASEAVRSCLIRECNVNADRAETVYEWLCREPARKNRTQMRDEFRANLGLAPDDILCISVGYMQWRKGTDLLPLIAHRCTSDPRVHFLWLGEGKSDYISQLEIDLQTLGLDSRVHLVGASDNPDSVFCAADIFLLPSREDAYPLVMLEAAAYGIPIVCFNDSGGAPEFTHDGAGLAVEYLDIDALADKILLLADSPDERTQLGTTAQQRVYAQHQIDLAGSQIESIFLDVVKPTAT